MIKKLTLEDTQGFLIVLVFVTLPISVPINSVLIIASCLLSIFMLIKSKKWLHEKTSYTLPVFFLLFVVSLLWSSNIKEGLYTLEQRLSFLVIPLFFIPAMKSIKLYKRIMFSWIGTITTLSLISLSYAIFQIAINQSTYFINSNGDRQFYLYYTSLIDPINVDPLYFSLYISLSILYLIHYLIYHINRIPRLQFVLLIVLISFLLMFIILLSSRGGLIALIGAIIVLVLSLPKHRWIVSVIFTSFFLTLLALSPYTRSKISTMMSSIENGFQREEIHSANMRILNWTIALEAIEKNLPLGTGAGSDNDALKKVYKKNGYNLYFNAHSTYLQTTLSLGIVGILYFIYMIFSQLKIFYLNKSTLALSFLILLVIAFLTESVLSRQKGIVFFTLFYSLFIAHLPHHKTLISDI